MDDVIYKYIVLRYGELTTKGKNRKDFINCLYNNMRYLLKDFKALTYNKYYDGIFIHLNGVSYNKVKERLQYLFGYAYFAGAIAINSDLDEIKEAAYKVVMQKKRTTFKVVTKRNYKLFPYHSDDINRAVASYILKNSSLKVDVHQPDCYLNIIVKKDVTYVMDDKVQGWHGYPVGINQKALLMLSGGIDSPVAGFVTMKRGMRIECIHFASMPYTSKQAVDKVLALAKILSQYQGEILVHIIPFTDLQLAVYKNADESYAITLLRRMMYRIADLLAQRRKLKVIVNGESVGQVASQTLQSMEVISSVCKTMILRPLCMSDKLDIITYANKIKTYDTSILPYEDCCTIFAPKNPVTMPRLEKCEYFEQKFDYNALIEKCLEEAQHVLIKAEIDKNSDLF